MGEILLFFTFAWIFSFFQVTKTTIEAWKSSNVGDIPRSTLELSALEHQNYLYLILLHSSAFIFDRIFIILARKEDKHNVSDKLEFRPDSITDCGVSYP